MDEISRDFSFSTNHQFKINIFQHFYVFKTKYLQKLMTFPSIVLSKCKYVSMLSCLHSHSVSFIWGKISFTFTSIKLQLSAYKKASIWVQFVKKSSPHVFSRFVRNEKCSTLGLQNINRQRGEKNDCLKPLWIIRIFTDTQYCTIYCLR